MVLRGSIIRVVRGGTTQHYAVPATGDVYTTTAQGAKIQLIAKRACLAGWPGSQLVMACPTRRSSARRASGRPSCSQG